MQLHTALEGVSSRCRVGGTNAVGWLWVWLYPIAVPVVREERCFHSQPPGTKISYVQASGAYNLPASIPKILLLIYLLQLLFRIVFWWRHPWYVCQSQEFWDELQILLCCHHSDIKHIGAFSSIVACLVTMLADDWEVAHPSVLIILWTQKSSSIGVSQRGLEV